MKFLPALACFLSAFACATAAAPATPAGWNLIWSDEFDTGTQPDPARWDYDVGGQGWGNNELQFYTSARPENARIEAGHLIIEARREKWESRQYTSARLVTKNRGDWSHGRFEIRAKLPLGRGTWPAIWMLPTVWNLGNGGWPDNGEIDIMEHVGYDPGVVHASTHSQKNQWRNKNQRTATIPVPDAGEAFHTYTLEWDAEEIRIFLDDHHYFTSRKEGGDWTSWPFMRPFHLVLNLAVGGDWGGAKGVDETIWPRRMEVDYVRVYQKAAP
ncbi:Beta-glucanase precursor [Lacunisphaera limnophila]|uniref:Beta-glucanase n=1 Tax=Lacunisphaera limnophila TaxID=1838286 RepID=A0A1D8AU21_9BACT|nr:glycoside hydrolase family 16 protein [Lacunisphaera limnophila]AOS44356.1 Beta-glucanase precursor [Lacunisphaera limnophila]